MKLRLAAFVICTMLLRLPSATCQETTEVSDSKAVELTLGKLEATWNEAHLKGDIAALKDLWSDEISIIVPEMPPMSKGDVLKMWQQIPVRFTEYRSEALSTRIFDNTAITIGQIHRQRDFGGRKAADSWIFTKVYLRMGGKWRVIGFHASAAPIP